MNPAEEFQPLTDSIFIEKVMRARATPPGAEVHAGVRAFEEVQARMRAGVRMQHPDFTPEQVDREVGPRFVPTRQMSKFALLPPLE